MLVPWIQGNLLLGKRMQMIKTSSACFEFLICLTFGQCLGLVLPLPCSGCSPPHREMVRLKGHGAGGLLNHEHGKPLDGEQETEAGAAQVSTHGCVSF